MTTDEKITELLIEEIQKVEQKLLKELEQALRSGQFNDVDIAQITSQLDFLQEANRLGLGSAIDDYFKGYEEIIKQLQQQANDLGLKGLVGIPINDLENFSELKAKELLGRAGYYADQLKSNLIGNLIAGTPFDQMIESLRQTQLADYQLRIALMTGLKQFRTLTTAKIYEDEPETKFVLDGPIDEKNRPTCRNIMLYQPKEGYTRKQIDEGAWTKLARQGIRLFGDRAKTTSEAKGTVAGQLIPSLQKELTTVEYSFLDTGGTNCRHEPLAVYKGVTVGR